jgi:hypothetical protein
VDDDGSLFMIRVVILIYIRRRNVRMMDSTQEGQTTENSN